MIQEKISHVSTGMRLLIALRIYIFWTLTYAITGIFYQRNLRFILKGPAPGGAQ